MSNVWRGQEQAQRTGHLLRQIIHPAVRTETIEMLCKMLEARRPP